MWDQGSTGGWVLRFEEGHYRSMSSWTSIGALPPTFIINLEQDIPLSEPGAVICHMTSFRGWPRFHHSLNIISSSELV